MFQIYQLADWLSIQNFNLHFTKVTRKCIVEPCVFIHDLEMYNQKKKKKKKIKSQWFYFVDQSTIIMMGKGCYYYHPLCNIVLKKRLFLCTNSHVIFQLQCTNSHVIFPLQCSLYLLVHLDQRSRWTIAITWRPSSVNFSHFKLLRNHWANWNQT
jgi:CDP-diglyceride synthetase